MTNIAGLHRSMPAVWAMGVTSAQCPSPTEFSAFHCHRSKIGPTPVTRDSESAR
jgi:hypothetical protein